ncbi:MAG: glutamate racemase [Gammaproteobacteria bacterium]|nr:glutamate racemase [Gammaproteobacteria bacterium]
MNTASQNSTRLKLDPKWPIGVLDSGLGGLTVVKAIQKQMPGEDIIYIADNKYLPYGDRSREEIIDRAHRLCEFYSAYPVKAIVMACNTATAAAIKHCREHFDLPIIGVEPGIKPACEITQTGNIGVLATAGTLRSQKYANLRNLVGKDVKVFEQACVGLVQAIEDEYPDFSETRTLLRLYLDEFKNNQVDTVVLGCTHYPLIEQLIHEEFHAAVTINTSSAIARQLHHRLDDPGLENPNNISPLLRVLASQVDSAYQEKVTRLIKSEKSDENPVIQLPAHFC